jgi:hypothetical protein
VLVVLLQPQGVVYNVALQKWEAMVMHNGHVLRLGASTEEFQAGTLRLQHMREASTMLCDAAAGHLVSVGQGCAGQLPTQYPMSKAW